VAHQRQRPKLRPAVVGAGNGAGIQSVARALSILELFGERRPTLTTTEIAGLTGLNRATAYRFCQTLLNLGYLEETAPRRFRPGLKAVSLAQAALSSRELPDLALPYLRELRERTGETVNLALRDGAEVVYVSRLLSNNLLALRLFVGSRLPAYASSLGRAMLAYLPEDEVEALLSRQELKAYTEHTLVDPRRLMAELRRIRSRGYAINDQELVLGILGIAAPVFGISGRPVAAVNLSIARQPDQKEIDESLAPQVMETARAISDLATQLAVDVASPSRLR
jgi:PcaR/PcaU/PobR family beta-ketoadipate pathway transcriptional regulator